MAGRTLWGRAVKAATAAGVVAGHAAVGAGSILLYASARLACEY